MSSITKKKYEEQEFTAEASLKIPKDEEIEVQFDNSWPHKGLILRIRITRACSWKYEIEMTKENVKTRCDAAYSYLRKVLPAARKKGFNFPRNSSEREEAKKILKGMVSFMKERNLLEL